jgi:hypothetical protein
MTVKTLRHLEKNPTFEELVATGETWKFPADLEIYGRAAINFRNSFYGSQLDPVGSVVDENHDEKVEKVLAVMKQFAEQQAARKEQKREENRSMFAENLPRANTEAEHAHPEVGTQTSVPTASSGTQASASMASSGTQASATTASSGTQASAAREATNFGALGQAGSAPSFLEKMARRQKQFPKEANHFTHRMEINRARQEARQKADRGRELNHKRQDAAAAANAARAQQFQINTPPLSPRSPPKSLKEKYDQRLLRATAKRNPKPEMHRAPRQETKTKDILHQKRGLDIKETEVAKKRPGLVDRSTLRKRRRQ